MGCISKIKSGQIPVAQKHVQWDTFMDIVPPKQKEVIPPIARKKFKSDHTPLVPLLSLNGKTTLPPIPSAADGNSPPLTPKTPRPKLYHNNIVFVLGGPVSL